MRTGLVFEIAESAREAPGAREVDVDVESKDDAEEDATTATADAEITEGDGDATAGSEEATDASGAVLEVSPVILAGYAFPATRG